MTEFWQTTWEEIQRAARTLWRAPGFTFWTIVLITATIGAVTSLGSAAYELLHGRLPFGRANELVMIWSDLPQSGYPRAPLSGPEIYDLRERTRSFTGIAAMTVRTVTLGFPEDPLQIGISPVTGNFFSVVEAAPLYGRTFTQDDEGTGKTPTVVLSWALWQTRFGGDPSIVGRRIPLGGNQTVVIGVMPEWFHMAFAPDTNIPENIQAWVPINEALPMAARNRYFLRVVARLQSGVSPASASSELSNLSNELVREWPSYAASGRKLYVAGLTDDLARPVRVAAYALLFAGVFLVLLGFVNLSGLLIARAAEQRKQHAICQAIGASVARVRNQTLLQAGILSLIGCVLGVASGKLGLIVLRHVRPPSLARIDHATLTWPILFLIFSIAVVATILLAWVSRLAIIPFKVSDIVGTRVDTAPRHRLRAGLIVVQVSLALLFLVCSALCMRTFVNVLRTEIGFRPEHVLTVKYSINPLKIQDFGEQSLLHKRMTDAVAGIPGVQAVGSMSHLPLDGLPTFSMTYRSAEAAEGTDREADVRPVSPGLLAAVGGHLRAGRFFEETDNFNGPAVAVVDRSLAERTWPGQDPIGRKIIVGTWAGAPPETMTVVGVIDHMRYKALEMEVREQLYVSIRQFPYGPWALVVRTSLDPDTLIPEIRRRVHEIDPRIPIWDTRLLADYYDDATADRRFTAMLLSIFAAAALMLAAIGVYSLLIYIVAARRNEFGIRMALGAESRRIVFSVLRESMLWAVLGSIVTGLIFFPLVTRFFRSLLYGVTPYDPFSWVGAATILVLMVLLASWIPAFAAGRTNPADLMRSQ